MIQIRSDSKLSKKNNPISDKKNYNNNYERNEDHNPEHEKKEIVKGFSG